MTVPFYLAEAFTKNDNEAYSGNPAGIVLLNYDDDLSDDTKQKISATLQASTTAFVSENGWKKSTTLTTEAAGGGGGDDTDSKILKRYIRWFTPISEVPMCGHATFATARVLSSLFENLERIDFDTKFRGMVMADVDVQQKNGHEDPIVCLDFPSNVPSKIPPATPWLDGLARIFLGSVNTGFEDVQYSSTQCMLLVILKRVEGQEPLETLRKINPNYQQLLEADLGGLDVHGVTVTIKGDAESTSSEKKAHCYSRQFSPFIGINEDPVCGSAHTMVIPYWTNKLKMHGQHLRAHQASPRGGDLHCIVTDEGRVQLAGRGRIVAQGRLNV